MPKWSNQKEKKQHQPHDRMYEKKAKNQKSTGTHTDMLTATSAKFKWQMISWKSSKPNISFSIGKTWFLHFLNMSLFLCIIFSITIWMVFERNAAATMKAAAAAAWLRFHYYYCFFFVCRIHFHSAARILLFYVLRRKTLLVLLLFYFVVFVCLLVYE